MAFDPNSSSNRFRGELSNLYSDLNVSLKHDSSGNIVIVKNKNCITQSIKTILGTSKGERIMLPEFGSNLSEYVFEQLDLGTADLIEAEIETALDIWENRISVIDITVSQHDDDNLLIINIEYAIVDTGEIDNFIGRIQV